MKSLLFLIFIVLNSSLFAQKMYSEKYTICPLQFILEDQEQYITYEPNDSMLVVDFLQGIEEKYIDKLQGAFLFQVMMDTAYNVCCVSYTNKSTIPARKIDMPTQIISMEGWKRIAPEREADNICALINIYIDKYEYKVQHLGYNRNKGKHMLQSSVYKRKMDSLPPARP